MSSMHDKVGSFKKVIYIHETTITLIQAHIIVEMYIIEAKPSGGLQVSRVQSWTLATSTYISQ